MQTEQNNNHINTPPDFSELVKGRLYPETSDTQVF